ncbi:unnamed protein product [Clonostachys rosea f. rosea IK726]|uniref:Uncharacterized protein n=1 Tax=Clonostachys rosea f. rosea IK726 TaxID=1349383 RepID=A0ACA9TXJ9_BIOOC|nr:unnamed protein product [Clonostachys rosea f. rosea IK726]
MAGKRKNKTSSKARRQAPRFFPPLNDSETPSLAAGSQNQVAGSEDQVEIPSQAAISSIQFGEPQSPVAEMPPKQAAAVPPAQFGGYQAQVAMPSSSNQVPAATPAQDAASLKLERDRLNHRMKDNAWNRALLSTQIKQTQRDIMRTKLLGTYEISERTGDLLSEFILKLHKRERELEQLEVEQKKLDAAEKEKK